MLLTILKYGDPKLRIPATPVLPEEFGKDWLKVTVQSLFQTMYANGGVGLAATQVGLPKQIAVIDIDQQHPITIINPEILRLEGSQTGPEGCLSIGGVNSVTRFQRIVVRAQNETGSQFEFDAEGIVARAFQHELDHLSGKLFIDHLSPLRRSMIIRRLGKTQGLVTA